MFDNNPPMYKCNWLQIKQLCLHSVLSHEGSSVIKTLQVIVHFPSLEKNHFETEPRPPGRHRPSAIGCRLSAIAHSQFLRGSVLSLPLSPLIFLPYFSSFLF